MLDRQGLYKLMFWRSVVVAWIVFIFVYGAFSIFTLYPFLKAILNGYNLKEAEFSFEDSNYFNSEQKKRLSQHYSRLQGTLAFWKNNAIKYGSLHFYCVFWVIFGGLSIPVLIQFIDGAEGMFGRICVTLVSMHVALLSAIHKGFKVEQNYKNYRIGESEYFDLRRRLLDQPYLLSKESEDQIDVYFSTTEAIRRDMRVKEVDSIASFEDVKLAVNEIKEGLSKKNS
jgi:hypothetical protein